MNSISYLDSVLSRSFVNAEHSSLPPTKRSRSHSSLPGTRRTSSTSLRKASSSSLRRWSQEQGAPDAHAVTTDESATEEDQPLRQRTPRWSALWGLTGWLDDAIHPDGLPPSSPRQTARMLSLDDLALRPAHNMTRRATSSSSSTTRSRRHRGGSRTSGEEENGDERRRSKRRSRMAASLTLDPPRNMHWDDTQPPRPPNEDLDLMSEKEREDIVDFVGGDFAPDELERQRERSASLGSVDQHWAESPQTDARSGAAGDLQNVDEETLLDAAKGEPSAMQVVADEDPSSSVADPDPTAPSQTKGNEDELRRSSRLSSQSDSTLIPSDAEHGVISKRKRSSRPSSVVAAATTVDSSPRARTFSLILTLRRTLSALRDLVFAIIMSPIHCVRLFRSRRAVRPLAGRSHAATYEKLSSSRSRSPNKSSDRESISTVLDAAGHTPVTSEEKPSSVYDMEPVTEEQAAKSGTVWKALHARTPSRLLPNPHRIDPMLAHDRKALPIDEGMAEKEARMEAERQARIAKGRAARRNAAAAAPDDVATTTLVGSEKTLMPSFVSRMPRTAASSVIHHTPKILVLDLDETLIHSTSRSPSQYITGVGGRTTTSGFLGLEAVGAVLGLRANDNPRRIRPHMVEVVLDGRSVLYHVYKRPWVDYFLRKVAGWYTVVVFTASVQEYADPVIDWLDQGRGLISARLFRESCSFKNGSYVKNLAVVDQDLAKVCLVDNSPASYAINRANGVPIEGWTHDPNDEALLDLLPILDSLRFATDVRHILGIRGFSSTPT